VAIVNRSLPQKFLHDAAAVAVDPKQDGASGATRRVVGVVGTTKYQSLRDSAPPIMYFPRSQQSAEAQYVSFELRTSELPLGIVPSATKAIGH